MCTGWLPLPLRPTPPPPALGIVVAVSFIAAETLLAYPLGQITSEHSMGMIYLLGVLVVSTVWGLLPGMATLVASAAGFVYYLGPNGPFTFEEGADGVALAVFLAVGLLASSIAELARSRAIETYERRQEAELSAELGRQLLRTDDLRSALPAASRCLARALELPSAALELEAVAGDERRAALPLRDGATPAGTLLVPADLPEPALGRLRERVVPSLQALLRAGRDREAMVSSLKTSHERHEAMLNALPDLMFRFDGKGTYLEVWPERSRGLMLPRDGELVGHSVSEVLPRDLAGRFLQLEAQVLRDGQMRTIEYELQIEGRRAAFEGRIVPCGRDQVLAIVRNTTDRKQAAEEQAALRRVATLVARGGAPTDVFGAVTVEVYRLLKADATRLLRYEPDGTATIVADQSEPSLVVQVGTRLTLEGENVAACVLRTGSAARMDTREDASGSIAALQRKLGIRSAVGSPILVEGSVWGAMTASWTQPEPLPAGIEGRMADFTELVATAIANAESRAQLTASRARIVAAGDEARRRIERDLHDGTQQRLVALALALRAAEDAVPPGLEELEARLSHTAKGLAGVVEDLQEISRGIHPAILSMGGLGPALKTLARRSAVPVELDVRATRRLPERVEVAAYYVVSEALTNVAKHARASLLRVALEVEDGSLHLSVRDDGVGGADPGRGSGLMGLRDRVEALGGRIEIASPPGSGTSLVVRIPIEQS